jgi:hypothetical protein
MKGSCVVWPSVDQTPEVELIATGSTAKASEDVAAQMYREATGIVDSGRVVKRTGTAKTFPSSPGRAEAEEPEDVLHRDAGAERPIVDTRH